ncbi:hypothetical protein GTW51_19035 [Aurantimonas aggregata]|uniref:ATP-dependent Clp protease proteolytic subunit n=1 Tax=Aurantimonas aggregata TaxID=2047720 RepID=A0A6L9MLL2_9HYPH|nr:Clp protease ClpP [Aurantimonas aggregata]NDV88794.1 hypothetical protein [Aurantimonas aggregata]
MACILNGSDLHLVGAVGFDIFDDYFTHADVLLAFARAGRDSDLTIHLNSPGGFTDQGEGIANAIKMRAGKTTVVVTGVAMSAATIIACAADEIVMCQGALWMVHEPQITLFFADSKGVESAAQYQRLVLDAYAEVYVERTGKTDGEVRAWMSATTYFGADEAIEAGFADRKSADVIDFAEAAPAFPYADQKIFAHAPDRLVARAREKDWTLRAAKQPTASAAATPGQSQEIPMTDKDRADALAAEIETLKAEMKASKDADTTASLQEELETLRAEKQARENTDAIMALEEAKGREPQAKALADAGVKAEAAKAILAASGKVEAENEPRRLNGQGLTGKTSPTTAQAPSMVANMRKLLGQKEVA